MHLPSHDRSATAERSVLAMLRTLVPRRPLTPSETLRIAELQANRLLEHFDIRTPAVPDEIVSELPRLRVIRERGLPVSGAAHWDGRYWVITLSADEPRLRRRFSLMHEFKHVMDHTVKDRMYADRPLMRAEEQAERVADYFAACLLMPKRVVKRVWFEGPQNIEYLSAKLDVSPAALRFRLDQLGLIDRPKRCDWRSRQFVPARPRITSSLARAAAGGSQ
jgi:Zn-dependent peptidase ImmA (M78 family)